MVVVGGIDVGGTKIAFGLVDPNTGELLSRGEHASDAALGADAVLERIHDAGQTLARTADVAGSELTGIGVGIPELVTPDGEIASDWNFDLSKREVVGALVDCGAVELDSDVRCGARAELRFGAGRIYQNFTYVSIGTGISAAQIIDGRILVGARGFAIHFGTSPLVHFDADGREGRFCLEENAAGLAIATRWAKGHEPLSAKDLLEGRGGNEGSEYVRQTQPAMASYLGQMINMLDPEAMIIGGGMGRAESYFEPLCAMLPEFIWAESAKNIPVLRDSFSGNGGIIGAAAIISADDRKP